MLFLKTNCMYLLVKLLSLLETFDDKAFLIIRRDFWIL